MRLISVSNEDNDDYWFLFTRYLILRREKKNTKNGWNTELIDSQQRIKFSPFGRNILMVNHPKYSDKRMVLHDGTVWVAHACA